MSYNPVISCNSVIKRVYVFLFILFLINIPATAAIQISADVDNISPVVGGRITYTITISGGASLPDVEIPDFDGLEIVMGPSTSSSIEMVNGSISQSKSWTYILRTIKAGKHTIDAARVKYKRKYYNSNKIELNVQSPDTPPTTVSSKSNNDDDHGAVKVSKTKLPEVFITATADKKTVYKLQMITVTYRLYLSINVSGYDFAKQPQARGFWQEEFEVSKRPVLNDVTIQGKQYKSAVIRKIGLFPTRTGELTLDPLTIDCTVEVPSNRRNRRDPFDDFFGDSFFSRRRREVRSLSTEPLTLTVLDLPYEGRQANFKGDVGDYQLRVDYDKRQLAQHDALTVKVIISGEGYLKSIDAPKMQLPSTFEVFDPTVDENIKTYGTSVKGSKAFTYLVIPRTPGNYTLKPISFSFFNPTEKRYKTVESGGTSLKVTKSSGDLPDDKWTQKSDVTLIDSDIRFIRQLSSPLKVTVKPIYNSAWFYIFTLIFPGLYLTGLGAEAIWVKRTSDPLAVRRRRAPDIMRKQLKTAKKMMKQGSTGKAVDTAGRGLAEYAGAITGIATAGLTLDVLKEQLNQSKIDHELINKILSLLSETDRIRFSSVVLDTDKANELLNKFSKTAEELDRIRIT
ncbi:BatD family protein [bacterium]|nr:BatD family protein [bacterium]